MAAKLTTYHSDTALIEAVQYGGPDASGSMASARDLYDMGFYIEPAGHWGGACNEVGHEDDWTIFFYPGESREVDARLEVHVGDWIICGLADGVYTIRDDAGFSDDVSAGIWTSEAHYREEADKEQLRVAVCFAHQHDILSEGQARRLLNVNRYKFERIMRHWIEETTPPLPTIPPES